MLMYIKSILLGPSHDKTVAQVCFKVKRSDNIVCLKLFN